MGMSAQAPAPAPVADAGVSGSPDDPGDFDLDVRIVESGNAVDALLCSTDNGCGTQSYNGC